MKTQFKLDTHYGKFDSLMACYLFQQVLLNGDFGDDEYSDGEGTWGNRYGRRVLEGNDQGFVSYTKLDSLEEAESKFRKVAEGYEQEDEDA